MFRESMDIVQGPHGFSGYFTDGFQKIRTFTIFGLDLQIARIYCRVAKTESATVRRKLFGNNSIIIKYYEGVKDSCPGCGGKFI